MNTSFDILNTQAGRTYEVEDSDVAYSSAQHSLQAHIYKPVGEGPFPILVDVHGGGWTQFDRMRDRPIVRDLSALGMVVVSLDYRLRHEGSYFEAMQDVSSCIKWIKANAKAYNATTEKIGGIGFSSGGHQILMTALRPRHKPYGTDQAAELDASLSYIVCCGCAYDLVEATVRRRPGPDSKYDHFDLIRYIGTIAGVIGESPQHVLNSNENVTLPPLLMCQAGADVLPGFESHTAIEFMKAYAARGGFVELAIFPNAGHIFLNPGLVERSEAMDRGLAAIRHYIARQLLRPATQAPGPKKGG